MKEIRNSGSEIMRQAATLASIWLAIIGVLLGVTVFDLDDWAADKFEQLEIELRPDECAGMPEPFLGRCHKVQSDFRGPLSPIEDAIQRRIHIYNSPLMKGFPSIWLNEKHGIFDVGFNEGPMAIKSRFFGFSFDVRDDEFAAVDANAMWVYFDLKYSCSISLPRAVVFAQGANELDEVSIYKYIGAGLGDMGREWVNLPIDLTIQPWPDMAALKAFQEEGRAYDKAAMEKDPSIKRWRDIEFLETPRSLSDETGIDQIVTYAFRISFINQAGEVEVSSTNRVIVLPYKEGNLELVSMVTRLNDEKPDPKPWQHVWRNMRFDDGPPKAQSFVDNDGQTHQGQSLANFIYQNSTCEEAHKLPPRWAWPKDLPRYWETQ